MPKLQKSKSARLKIHQYSALCAPIMSQFAAIEALKSIDSFQPDMKSSFMARRNFIVNKLNKIGLSTELPTGAFYCFPSIKSTGLTSEEFALKLLDQEKVAVVPGSVFGEGGEGYIRCCYAASMEVLKECCVRIQRFIHNNK